MPKGKKQSMVEKWTEVIAYLRARGKDGEASDVVALCQELDKLHDQLRRSTKAVRRALNAAKKAA